ncbi:TRAP transporter substrate-binding protein [Polymorphum gilvum]|uniref:Trap dicarboxylate transporter, dctp subunit n=1 Tax=Polymorphum gilvum (strain LMG 25793 / CGMCC 1.9160 / SL003B-26A1) TaxID=991905 RepID=F2IZJ9_POLGS|nr:TRAP transporter substrate-binding protein [Polymorphum gilvum]ADZ69556.1 Trap dicarboxylate transporter, dctp subunit [Polymorphum gilvum SL003B-26A1]
MTHFRRAAAASAFAVSIAMAGTAMAQTVLNFAHSTAQNSHYSMGVQAFAKTLSELSGGKYEIREQAAGALGGERDVIEGLQIGSVELTISSTGPLGNFVPEALVLDLPFLFKDYANARAVLDGAIGQELLDKINENNLVGLAWSENGFRHITNSRQPINTPADLNGLKIRTMENQVHMEAFRAAGAAPTPMAFPEVFAALQQRVIDGQENPIPVITSAKFWEVQDNLTLTGHVYSPAIILASPSLWDGLSDEEKGWFAEAAKAAVAATRAKVEADEANGVDLLRQNGMKVVEKVDLDAFRKAVSPAYDTFVAKYGDDMLKRIQAAQE